MNEWAAPRSRMRFDRNEIAGSMGDIGTDLPLIIALILVAGLDVASVFILFGAAQILTGLLYGVPMPMQPLKAMAVIVITQQLTGDVLYGAGIAIGVIMLVLALSGALKWLARVIPHAVVRGIQVGLGLKLAHVALTEYVPADGTTGYILAAGAFVIVVVLLGNRRFPPAFPVIGLGVVYAIMMGADLGAIGAGMGLSLPEPYVPSWDAIVAGVLLLALPQIPLSLSNSVIATERTLRDLFPERNVGVRKLGITFGLVNIAAPFASGIPVCHGCGGLAGHYAFGGRTGDSVVIYGSFFLLIGLFFAMAANAIVGLFPLPVLGVILLFEALVLMMFLRDITPSRENTMIALLVAVLALSLPHGFLVGIVVGTVLYYVAQRYPILRDPIAHNATSMGQAS